MRYLRYSYEKDGAHWYGVSDCSPPRGSMHFISRLTLPCYALSIIVATVFLSSASDQRLPHNAMSLLISTQRRIPTLLLIHHCEKNASPGWSKALIKNFPAEPNCGYRELHRDALKFFAQAWNMGLSNALSVHRLWRWSRGLLLLVHNHSARLPRSV